MNHKHKRKVTPEMAVKLLKKEGTQVTLEEAKLIVDFMYNLAEIAYKIYVK